MKELRFSRQKAMMTAAEVLMDTGAQGAADMAEANHTAKEEALAREASTQEKVPDTEGKGAAPLKAREPAREENPEGILQAIAHQILRGTIIEGLDNFKNKRDCIFP